MQVSLLTTLLVVQRLLECKRRHRCAAYVWLDRLLYRHKLTATHGGRHLPPHSNRCRATARCFCRFLPKHYRH